MDPNGGLPRVSFIPASGTSPVFSRDINDLVEIKKEGISVPRAVLGWVSGADIESQTLLIRFKTMRQRVITDVVQQKKREGKKVLGLESEEGETYELQGVVRREHLFIRLLAMNANRWERYVHCQSYRIERMTESLISNVFAFGSL